MTQVTRFGKKRWAAWALLFGIITIVAIVAVLNYLGYVDLTWLQNGWLGTFYWATNGYVPETVFTGSIVNSLLIAGAFFALGMGFYWFLKRYFIGDKTAAVAATGTYTPQGQTIPQSQTNKDETVIS